MHAALAEVAARGWRVAVAESCTGGLLGASLTADAGASDAFAGGVLAYANEVKERLLHVPADVLEASGAVSEACAKAMASGAARACGCDVGVAVTGTAGPGGGSDAKPVGTVWVAVATPETVLTQEHRFRGSRAAVREQAVSAALTLLRAAVRPASGEG